MGSCYITVFPKLDISLKWSHFEHEDIYSNMKIALEGLSKIFLTTLIGMAETL
jgi:hypothetical protein